MDIAASKDWNRIESVLMNHYQVGGSKEGAEAYSPILLFKGCHCIVVDNASGKVFSGLCSINAASIDVIWHKIRGQFRFFNIQF